ncbi:MAG: hypothetical protein ABSE15_09830 [Candidatus Bathyarchaeia archaeon]|jgi:hypothetical protein
MKLEGYKLVFVAAGLIGVLLIATPSLAANNFPAFRLTFEDDFLRTPKEA